MKASMFVLCVAATGFMSAAAAQPERPEAKQSAAAEHKRTGEPYPFDTCPVTGKKLGSMGDPVIELIDGREIRFCCAPCIGTFEGAKDAYFEKLDARIVKDQSPLYPLSTSVVTGKDLPRRPVEWVYGNRLIRLGAAGEKKEFMKDPKRYLGALDKAAIAAQGPTYPLKNCVVSGRELGAEGTEPKDVTLAGRLVRVCSEGCAAELEKDPAKYIGLVDRAAGRVKETQEKDKK